MWGAERERGGSDGSRASGRPLAHTFDHRSRAYGLLYYFIFIDKMEPSHTPATLGTSCSALPPCHLQPVGLMVGRFVESTFSSLQLCWPVLLLLLLLDAGPSSQEWGSFFAASVEGKQTPRANHFSRSTAFSAASHSKMGMVQQRFAPPSPPPLHAHPGMSGSSRQLVIRHGGARQCAMSVCFFVCRCCCCTSSFTGHWEQDSRVAGGGERDERLSLFNSEHNRTPG